MEEGVQNAIFDEEFASGNKDLKCWERLCKCLRGSPLSLESPRADRSFVASTGASVVLTDAGLSAVTQVAPASRFRETEGMAPPPGLT